MIKVTTTSWETGRMVTKTVGSYSTAQEAAGAAMAAAGLRSRLGKGVRRWGYQGADCVAWVHAR